MFILSCSDLGAKDCDFEVEGTSAGEVVGKMLKHIGSEHPDQVGKMGRDQLMSKVKEIPEEEVGEM